MEGKCLPDGGPKAERSSASPTSASSSKPPARHPDRRFQAAERLKSRKVIDRLFEEGNRIHKAPITLHWLESSLNTESPAQAVFVVAKKRYRQAVVRNRIRRQMREVYRRHRALLYQPLQEQSRQCALAIAYHGEPRVDFKDLEDKLISALLCLMDQL